MEELAEFVNRITTKFELKENEVEFARTNILDACKGSALLAETAWNLLLRKLTDVGAKLEVGYNYLVDRMKIDFTGKANFRGDLNAETHNAKRVKVVREQIFQTCTREVEEEIPGMFENISKLISLLSILDSVAATELQSLGLSLDAEYIIIARANRLAIPEYPTATTPTERFLPVEREDNQIVFESVRECMKLITSKHLVLLDKWQRSIVRLEEATAYSSSNLEKTQSMGRVGKERKKRKLQNASAAIDALGDRSGGFHPSKNGSSGTLKRPHPDDDELDDDVEDTLCDSSTGITQSELATTSIVLSRLDQNPESLRLPVFRPLRTLLFKLIKVASDQGINAGYIPSLTFLLTSHAGNTVSGRISEFISDKRWKEALVGLAEMRSKKLKPKLGALQRWVRDCDAANSSKKTGRDKTVMEVLDSVLRTADPAMTGVSKTGADEKVVGVSDCVIWHQPWVPPADKVERKSNDGVERSGKVVIASDEDKEMFTARFRVLAKEDGHVRRPANIHPMILYISDGTAIDTTSFPPISTFRVDLPQIPSCFMIRDMLSASECSQILRAMEAIGFTADEPAVYGQTDAASILAHNVFWFADKTLLGTLEERIKGLIPEVLECEEDGLGEGGVVTRSYAGINPRWRVYRYVPGSVYRPHIDGAWPRSALGPDGEYIYDDSNGKTWSRMTFLVYLNQNFKGGETPVTPQAGSVLVFPHGCVKNVLLHEGSGVLDGAKYIIRTDVLYSKK
ncbi:hypothetical protein HDU97_004074 [Phlyctochytrium planicorne]|nr:hypothetical protein HDU97_004074 [Phlyctochytrium planicorne]